MESNKHYLAHYGVLGMRWGIRRNQAQLRGKVSKLSNTNDKLESKRVQYGDKAARTRNKKYSLLTSKEKAEQLEFEAQKIEAKAAKVQARIEKNQNLMSTFNNTIDQLDKGAVEKGNRFFMKYAKATISEVYKIPRY